MSELLGHYNYWIVIVLMMTGFYTVIARPNLVKKVIGLFIFQTSVFILFISMAKIEGGTAPIIEEGISIYSNPLPHVLILTAIVVGISVTANLPKNKATRMVAPHANACVGVAAVCRSRQRCRTHMLSSH